MRRWSPETNSGTRSSKPPETDGGGPSSGAVRPWRRFKRPRLENDPTETKIVLSSGARETTRGIGTAPDHRMAGPGPAQGGPFANGEKKLRRNWLAAARLSAKSRITATQALVVFLLLRGMQRPGAGDVEPLAEDGKVGQIVAGRPPTAPFDAKSSACSEGCR